MATPLRTRRNLLLAGLLAAVALACAAAILMPGPSAFELSIARVLDVHDTNTLSRLDFRFPIVDTNDECVLLMRIGNPSDRELWLGRELVQPRLNGRWLAPHSAAWLNSAWFVATVAPRSHSDLVVAVVPRGTQSVRLRLEYKHEPPLYRAHCRSLQFLHDSQHSHKFASGLVSCLDRWAIAPLADRSFSRLKWRNRTFELTLPKPPAQPLAPADMLVLRQGRSPHTNESDFYLLNGTKRIVR